MPVAGENERGPAGAPSLPDVASVSSATAPLPPRFWLFVVALSMAVLIVYQPVWNGGFLCGDAAHVTPSHLRSWQGLWSIWSAPRATQQYYPLTHTFFWLQHRLWGDTPSGYHLINIILHAAAASMAGLILYRLAIRGAYFAAAIFALHPYRWSPWPRSPRSKIRCPRCFTSARRSFGCATGRRRMPVRTQSHSGSSCWRSPARP